ncbi:stage V sporulation protein SpoVABEA [Alkalicoccobacillus murimartini]|uniref:Stage V sporulation protein AE n=1 Tax=Alkalicoccobacillus murimartini TaxID=171685 RepID=A0ABT9YD72_9BACI|nr:stage V sporulation protein AE [Alkalicoccobacillus murimartini]MDQ0205807.1 stage V sporulation protein AE [Alkalicoccobacillus murimartini]
MPMKDLIFITDGDAAARKTVEWVARELSCRSISASAGNPSVLTGKELLSLIHQTPIGMPVLVMFDDCGYRNEGPGEVLMRFLYESPDVRILGAIAVASSTHSSEWTKVDFSIDRYGDITKYGVDKEGLPDLEVNRINGDTVYILDELKLPLVIGIGDIGKMRGQDELKKGCPITKKAVQIILERSGYVDSGL